MFGFYKEYYSAHGRATRLHYLIACLAIGAMGALLNIGVRMLISNIWNIDVFSPTVDFVGTIKSRESFTMTQAYGTLGFLFVFWLVNILLTTWPWITSTIRRLHDINLSGWWLLGSLLIMFAVGFFSGAIGKALELIGVHGDARLEPGSMVFYGVYILFFAVLFLKRGTQGTNRFGADQSELNAYFRQRKFEKRMEWKQSQNTGDKK